MSFSIVNQNSNLQPSLWVQRFASLIPAGEVLDCASGEGRNCPHLQALGLHVIALDRDPALLAQAAKLGVATVCHDLEAEPIHWPFDVERFSGIVICNYLHRALFPIILQSLAINGVLIIETFAKGNEALGKPSNPNFLLEPNELLQLLNIYPDMHLHVVAYECGYVTQPKPALIQRICIKKNRHIGEVLPLYK